MLTSMGDFLRYFGSINRRAMRDVGALPPEAEGWAPAVGEGEQGVEREPHRGAHGAVAGVLRERVPG